MSDDTVPDGVSTQLHFLHVRKTGGSAVKSALETLAGQRTKWGQLTLHRHAIGLRDIPKSDHCFFVVRDPVSRFISGFHSRLRRGAPSGRVPWDAGEALAFGQFRTARDLAIGLAACDPNATAAMSAIRHLKYPLADWLGKPHEVLARRHSILWVGRQECLDRDWDDLLRLLGLSSTLKLPSDSAQSNRSYTIDTLTPAGEKAVRHWYSQDYALLAVVDALRTAHLNGKPPVRGVTVKGAAGVVLLDQYQRVLVQYAPYRTGPFLPGGKISHGELAIQAAERELLEEMGIGPIHLELRLVDLAGHTPVGSPVHHFWFIGEVDAEMIFPVPDEVEVADWSWVSIAEARTSLEPRYAERLRIVLDARAIGATIYRMPDGTMEISP